MFEFSTFCRFAYARLADDDKKIVEAVSAFEDRESYLAWVRAWKQAWHETVAKIRQAKKDRKDPKEGCYAASRRQALRIVAYDLLVVRHAGKIRAARLRAERLLAATA